MKFNLAILVFISLILRESFQQQKKILFYGTSTSSHAKVNMGIATTLSKKYDVTIIQPFHSKDLKFLKENNVKVVMFPPYSKELADKLDPNYLQLDYLFNYASDTLQRMKNEKYDMIITEWTIQHQTLASYLDIPIYIHILGSMEPEFMNIFKLISTHSSQLSKDRYSSTNYTLFESVSDFAMNWKTRYQNAMRSPRYDTRINENHEMIHDLIKDKYPDFDVRKGLRQANLTITFSIESLTNPSIVIPQNHKFVSNRFRQFDQEMPQDIEQFISRYDKIILIGFGTYMSPSKRQLREMFQFAVLNPNYGFIIQTSKEASDRYIQNISETNIIVKDWIPQVQILNSNKTKLFITHGGKNSLIESFEYGVTPLIHPLGRDQHFFCQHVNMNLYGLCLPNVTHQALKQMLTRLERNNFYQDKVKMIQKVIAMEKEDNQDISYWVDYCFEVGTEHLQSPQYKRFNWITVLDADILIFLFLVVILVLLMLGYLCIRIVRKRSEARKTSWAKKSRKVK